MLTWSTLAVASALWALRPRGPDATAGRRLLGWLACAASLTLGVYSKNPLPVLLASIPVAATIVLTSAHRRRDLLWLLAANLVALGAVAPWYAYVVQLRPDAVEAFEQEVIQPRGDDAQPVYYYLGVFGLVAPWTIWLLSGLVHPFVAVIRRVRALRLVPWVWFVGLFALLSIPEAKQQRYILPIVPAAGLLIAAVWRDHAVLAEQGRAQRDVRPLIAIHWIGLAVSSVGLAVLLAFPDLPGRIVKAWEPPVASLGVGWAAALLVALIALAIAGGRAHWRGRGYGAALAGGAWALLALGVFWHGYGHAPSATNPLRRDAEVLRQRVGTAPIRLLREYEERQPEEEFRLYFGHLMPEIAGDDLAAYAEDQAGTIYVLAYDDERSAAHLAAAGFAEVEPIRTRAQVYMRLWRRP